MANRVTSKVKDVRRYSGSISRVFGAQRAEVKVGVFGAEGDKPHGTLTNVDVAEINEFGLGVPERSFIRTYFDENQDRLRKAIGLLTEKALFRFIERGGAITTADRVEILSKMGLFMVGEIVTRIRNRIDPENAEETIARKGSDVPLIDTGQLRSSITFAVNPDGNGYQAQVPQKGGA